MNGDLMADRGAGMLLNDDSLRANYKFLLAEAWSS